MIENRLFKIAGRSISGWIPSLKLAAYEKTSQLEPTNASYFFKVGTTISKYLDGVAHQLPYS